MSAEQLDALKAMLKSRGKPPSVEAWRSGFEAMAARFPDDPGVVRETAPGGELTHPPDGGSGAAVLYLHGGAFQVGSAAAYRHVAARLARTADASVLMLDYSRAPEAAFSVARDEAVAALARLSEARGAAKVAVAGDSCGANLALSALVERKARGGEAVAGAVLVSAYLDLTHSGASIVERAHRDPFIAVDGMAATAALYAGSTDPADPGVSPLFADLSGLPPLLLQVGSEEVLHDDSTRLAERAQAAGVDVTLEVSDAMVHAWPFFWPMLEEGADALDRAGAFLKRRFGR